jgi:hypothetical protein
MNTYSGRIIYVWEQNIQEVLYHDPTRIDSKPPFSNAVNEGVEPCHVDTMKETPWLQYMAYKNHTTVAATRIFSHEEKLSRMGIPKK